jgi:hypothetical protein
MTPVQGSKSVMCSNRQFLRTNLRIPKYRIPPLAQSKGGGNEDCRTPDHARIGDFGAQRCALGAIASEGTRSRWHCHGRARELAQSRDAVRIDLDESRGEANCVVAVNAVLWNGRTMQGDVEQRLPYDRSGHGLDRQGDRTGNRANHTMTIFLTVAEAPVRSLMTSGATPNF